MPTIDEIEESQRRIKEREASRLDRPPSPDHSGSIRQALQELLAAAEKAADYLPGGLQEGLDLHIAFENARRYV